jgi:pimeloyl-ACP methyl ester carboxylesterase
MARFLFVIAASALLVALVASTSGKSAVGHFMCPGKNISFKAADGTKLVAHRYGTGRTFVVLAHQADGDLCQWYPYAKRLTSLGYSALPFDFRGRGESQVRTGPAASHIERDVPAAVQLARRLGARKVFVIGASMGGWASVTAAPRISPRLTGLVSLSTPPQYGPSDATSVVSALTVPVVFVASRDEGLTEQTQALYDQTASTDKTLRLVPGDAHGVDLLSPVLGKPAWRSTRTLIETFLRTH